MLHELPAHELKEASPEFHARCREWAVRLLGATDAAGADDINRGFWKCLEKSNLTPSEEILAAVSLSPRGGGRRDRPSHSGRIR